MSNISLVALRQLNEIELSGYILEVVGPYTGVTNTGSLTGNFYPLYSNPSGYLNSFSGLNTGDFVTYPILTGNNIQLLATVGLLYYPNSNPSGFVTGGQTGVFYPLNSNPSGYITTGQTGAFAQSGNFYPLYSNPSGYLFLSGKTLNVPNINLSGGNLYSNQNIIISSSGLFEFISPYGIGFEMLNGAGSFEIIDSANSSTPFNYASSPNVFLLSDGMDFTSIDVVNRGLFDKMGNVSAAYSNRTLVDTGANITLDWNRKILSGVWNLGNNTGNFITTNQTGQFYPLNSNPSGYISRYGQSGAFIFSTPVTNGVNNQFINFPWSLGNSPTVLCTLNNNGAEFIEVQASGITSTGYWAQFSNTIDGTGYILSTLASLSTATGLATTVIIQNFSTGTTGAFYPLYTNPSGYITSGQTGAFGTAINTGSLTGQFYPLNSNPSGYISSLKTGAYIFSTQINSGVSKQFISFPYSLGNNPYVICNLNNISGTQLFVSGPSGITSSGYWITFSPNIDNSGYSLTTLVNTSTLTGLATTVIINNFTTGSTGSYYPLNSNPSGYITTGQTGSLGTPANVVFTTGNQNINGIKTFDGVSGIVMLGSQLSTAGATLHKIGFFSDIFNTQIASIETQSAGTWAAGNYPTNIIFSTSTGLLQTDLETMRLSSRGQMGLLNNNPKYTLDVSGSGNFSNGLFIKGNPVLTGGPYYPLSFNPSGYITTGQTGAFATVHNQSGAFIFSTPVFSGNSQQFIAFPASLGINPTVLCGLTNSSGNLNILVQASGITSTGYWATFSQTINDNDHYLSTLASLSTATGLATTVVINNIAQLTGVAGVSALNSLSGILTLTGVGNVSIIDNGQTIIISGNTGMYSSFVLNSQTGQFYSTRNPSGFITGLNTGSFITTGQTGAFYSSNNPSGFALASNLLSTGITLETQLNAYIDITAPNTYATIIEINALDIWTGSSTGIFYPYHSNPSGYLTGFNSGIYTLNSNTGIFITTGMTGAFITSINTGSLTGQFYPLNNNPSGFITGFNSGLYTLNSQTGNFITTVQTGNFTSVAITGGNVTSYINLSGISGISVSTGISGLVLFNGSNLVQTSQTGTFITSGQTGAFASAINLGITGNTLQLEINSLNSWTGTSTGLYYPLVNNPSNYITSGQTGNFITNSQTGAFASLINLGITGNVLQLEINSLSGYGNNIFSTIINLFNTGSSLQSEINALSGNLINSGYLISGALNNSGILLQNEINSLNIWSGNSTGLFYPIMTNPIGYNYEAVNKGLIFYYPFNEGSGTTIYDKANGIPATLTSGVTFTSGIFGGAINFTGPNTGSPEFVNVGTPSLLSGQTPITVCAWFNLSGNNTIINNIIISKFLGGGNGEFYLSIVGPNGIQFSTNASGGRQNIEFNAPYSLIDNNWHFGAATYDGFNTKLYCDGILLGNSTIQSGQLSGSNNSIYIGNYVGGGPQYNLSGSIAEPMVFNRTLSNQEIIYLNNKYALSNCLVSNYTNKTISGISSVFQSGSFLNSLTLDGNQVLTGVNTGLFITTGQTGAFYPYNSNPSGYLTSYLQSGSFVFSTTATSGINQQFIFFPGSLGTSPNVFCTLNNNTNEFIEVQASGITSTGYWAQFSNTIDRSGYTISTIATLSTSTGFATTVIINSGINIPWYNLTWGTGTVWNANPNVVEDRVRLYLTGNTTLQINNLYNGWEGLLQTIQTGNSTTGYSLTLPVGTKVMGNSSGVLSLTTQSGTYDMTAFVYDGINLFCNIGNQFD